jgi:cobalamin biosynthesis protein CbiD
MIVHSVIQALKRNNETGGIQITISVPDGEKLAEKDAECAPGHLPGGYRY